MKSYKELNESLADDLMKMKGAKARGSVADQKAARDALMAKRKETNPNPPQLGTSSNKYKLGDYDKKSNRSYSEEVELEEAHKIGSKVTIHKGTGKGIVGHIGEIRRKHKGDTNPSYTIFYGDRDAIRANKSQIKAVKESVELEEAHKIGSKVTIHKGTGTGIVGHIGEIRRKHKGDTNPEYTIFHGDREAIRANKSQIKAVKESVE